MTDTAFPSPGPLKRCAILGTAQSWTQCPWHDQSLEVWTLNDGYVLGVPRISRHYDIHPFHQMQFRPDGQRVIGSSQAHEVQIGAYLRPATHLEWLKTRPFPVFVNQARPDFPTSQTFPRQQILDFFASRWPYRVSRRGVIAAGKRYVVSTPSWMLMHAIMEGYQEIQVYGIHLATEWEYLKQRPNFEWLLGFAAGRDIKIVLPESAPICSEQYEYGFELKADIPQMLLQQKIATVKHEGAKIQSTVATVPWYQRGRKKDLAARRAHLEVELLDAKQELGRLSAGG